MSAPREHAEHAAGHGEAAEDVDAGDRAHCCTGCRVASTRPGVFGGPAAGRDLGCRHSSPPTGCSPRRPCRPTALPPEPSSGTPWRTAPSSVAFPECRQWRTLVAQSRECFRCPARQPAAWMMGLPRLQLTRWSAPCFVESDCWIFVPPDPLRRGCGTTWVSAGVPAQGAGSGGFGTQGVRGGLRPEDQRLDDLFLAAAGPDRPGP